MRDSTVCSPFKEGPRLSPRGAAAFILLRGDSAERAVAPFAMGVGVEVMTGERAPGGVRREAMESAGEETTRCARCEAVCGGAPECTRENTGGEVSTCRERMKLGQRLPLLVVMEVVAGPAQTGEACTFRGWLLG